MKLLKGTIIGGLVILGLVYYTYTNLKYNSVYYAQHMPHKEGTEPDLVMLIENMGWIYKPEIDGIRYDDDGGKAIVSTKRNTVLSKSMGNFLYHKNKVTIGFDRTFKFNHVTDFSDEQTDHSDKIEEAEIKKEIRRDFAPVLDAQTKPFINLQWLFNLIYQDRFN